MKIFNSTLCLIVLLGGVSCAPKVVLNINGRPSEYLSAWLEKEGEDYLVFAELPVGRWEVELLREKAVPRVEYGNSRPVAKWVASKARLSEPTPFQLELKNPGGEGPAVMVEVRPKYVGQGFFEGALKVASWFAKR